MTLADLVKWLFGLLLVLLATKLRCDELLSGAELVNVFFWTFALLVVEKPVTAVAGAMTIAAKAKLQEPSR